jgi:hypothetical protein
MIQIERALHEEIALRVKAIKPACLLLPIPNGVYLPTRDDKEKRIAQRLIARMKEEGQLYPGAPDYVCLWDDGSGVIELKREAQRTLLGPVPAGRPSPAQRALEAQCAALGIQHRYCHSWDETHAALRDWGRMR